MICLFSDVLLEARGETEDDSAPKSSVEKPPSTLEMDAHEAKEMANAMLLNSPLPDAERSDERLPEEDGSNKLPKEGGDEKLLEETPIGKFIMPCTERVLPFIFPLVGSCNSTFPLDSQNPQNTIGRVEDVLQKVVSEVWVNTSQVSSGSALP